MALRAYIDESADGLGSHTAVMAGYVAKPEAWDNFSAEWKEELDRQKKPFFSATKKIFSGGGSTRNAEKFYRIIERHADFGISVTTNIPNYRKLMDRIDFPAEFREIEEFKKLKDPFALMYQAFIELSLHDKETLLHIYEPIDFIFDETSKYKELISRSFKYTHYSATKVGIPLEKLGAMPIFEDDKKSLPLQAADLLARLVRNTEVIGVQWDGSQMPWNKNKRIPCLCVDLGEAYFLGRMKHSFSYENMKVYRDYQAIS